MKRAFLLLLLLIGLQAPSGHAFIVLDNDGGEIVIVNRVSARYDSNIFASNSSESDLILTYRPTLQFKREAGLLHLDARAGVQGGYYIDNTDENYLDPHFNMVLSYPNGVERRFFTSLDLGYNTQTIADPVVGQILEIDTFETKFSVKYDVNDRWGVIFQPAYYDRSYNREGLSKVERASARLEAFYHYSPELTLYGGYRVRDITNEGIFGVSGGSNLFFVGGRGSLLTRMVGKVEAGIQTRSFDIGLADESEPYFDIGLSWAASDRLFLSFDVTQDFEVTANNFSVNPLTFVFELEYDWNDKILGNFGVEWTNFDYVGLLQGRSDDFFTIRLGANYKLTQRSLLDAGLIYSDRSSTLESANYDRLQFLLGYTLIY